MARGLKLPGVVLGTMGIPSPLGGQKAREAIWEEFRAKGGFQRLDTAIMYQSGETEKALGELGVAGAGFQLTAKVNPWFDASKMSTTVDLCGGLRPESVKLQLNESLKNLGTDTAHILYLHAPDPDTPVESTLEALKELYEEGKYEEWGLSNYAASQVSDVYHRSLAMGLRAPLYYQGMYNALTREVERELFPALRQLGMFFEAYNPLAGGILSGKHRYESRPSEGRFNSETVWGRRYQDRFWRKEVFESVDDLRSVCEACGTCITSASLRWLRLHSCLSEGDALVIGGSSVQHVAENTRYCCDTETLPLPVLDAFERAWEVSRSSCPPYYR